LQYIYYCPKCIPKDPCSQAPLEFAELAIEGLGTPEKLALKGANEIDSQFGYLAGIVPLKFPCSLQTNRVWEIYSAGGGHSTHLTIIVQWIHPQLYKMQFI
jgi:hypothetical protein